MNYTVVVQNPNAIENGISHIVNQYTCPDPNNPNLSVTCNSDPITPSIVVTTTGNTTLYEFSVPVIQNGNLYGISASCACVQSTLTQCQINCYSPTDHILPICSVILPGPWGIHLDNLIVRLHIRVINNTTSIDLDSITIMLGDMPPYVDYPTKDKLLAFGSDYNLSKAMWRNTLTGMVRYTNSYADLAANTDQVNFIAIQDRFFVANQEHQPHSYYTTPTQHLRCSGWTDKDIKYLERQLYVCFNNNRGEIWPGMSITTDANYQPNSHAVIFTNYGAAIHRSGDLHVIEYTGEWANTLYFTSWFHHFDGGQVKYGDKIYSAITPFLYLHAAPWMGKAKLEILSLYPTGQVYLYTYTSNNTIPDNASDDYLILVVMPIDYDTVLIMEGQSQIIANLTTTDFWHYPGIQIASRGCYFNILRMQQPSTGSILNPYRVRLVKFFRNASPKELDAPYLMSSVFAPPTGSQDFDFMPTVGGGLMGYTQVYDYVSNSVNTTRQFLFGWYKLLKPKVSLGAPNEQYLRYHYYYRYIL